MLSRSTDPVRFLVQDTLLFKYVPRAPIAEDGDAAS